VEATKKSILIIDDDEVFHLINEKLLSKAGLASKIHSVRSSQEALQIFNQYFARITDIPAILKAI
jgi:CheY-like chemotaxis protein